MVKIPHILGGRYEVGELIGRGGMAEVHIGRDSRLSRRIAIKILRADLASDTVFQARFRREAQSAAALNHPAIVGVFDTGEETIITENGPVAVPYIIMEYIDGRTVRSLLAPDCPVPIDEAIEITLGVLDALEYSHRHGIVHRDIKPGNVMITQTGAIKVMDFGIARAMADSAATMTQAQAVVGTAQYLSPEQARGEVVDARSDIYSTGCLLYELLTGRPPFQGDNPASVAYQHVNEAPRVPSEIATDIPQDLDTVVLHALAKNRDQRYSDAAAMRADLQVVLQAVRAGEGETATRRLAPIPVGYAPAAAPTPPPPPPVVSEPYSTTIGRAVPPAKKSPPWWIWVVLTILLVAGAIAVSSLLNKPEKEPDPEPTVVPTNVVEVTTVPQMSGMSEETVKSLLAAWDLTYERELDQPSDEVAKGLFLSSSPEPGVEVEKGSTVRVTFSAGPESVGVPDVSHQSQDVARRMIESADLVAGSTTSQDEPNFNAGEVIGTNPEAGEQVPPGTTVDLIVASGNVELPDVTGKPFTEAEQILTGLNLNVSSTYVETDEMEEGMVFRQSRSPGLVPQRTLIQLEIATAPPPAPSTPPPSPVEPPPAPPQPPQEPSSAPPSPSQPEDPVESPTQQP